MANSVFYVMAALRDCGWFWFMPYFGQYRTITEIMEEDRQVTSLQCSLVLVAYFELVSFDIAIRVKNTHMLRLF